MIQGRYDYMDNTRLVAEFVQGIELVIGVADRYSEVVDAFGLILPLGNAKRRPFWTPLDSAVLRFSSWGETRTPDPGIMSAVL
jgi:hypothetical protein